MEQNLLTEIEKFISDHKMAESTFGRLVMSDWRLIDDLRGKNRERPRRLWPETEAKIRDWMREYDRKAAVGRAA